MGFGRWWRLCDMVFDLLSELGCVFIVEGVFVFGCIVVVGIMWMVVLVEKCFLDCFG